MRSVSQSLLLCSYPHHATHRSECRRLINQPILRIHPPRPRRRRLCDSTQFLKPLTRHPTHRHPPPRQTSTREDPLPQPMRPCRPNQKAFAPSMIHVTISFRTRSILAFSASTKSACVAALLCNRAITSSSTVPFATRWCTIALSVCPCRCSLAFACSYSSKLQVNPNQTM